MKKIIIANCGECPHRRLEIHDFLPPYPKKIQICDNSNRKIENEMTIPEWCKLKDKE